MGSLPAVLPVLAAVLFSVPAPGLAAEAAPPEGSEPLPSTTSGALGPSTGGLAVAEGIVRTVDLAAHSVVIDVGGGRLSLRLDRNTLVYLPSGLATVFELTAGDTVRTGHDGLVALWVQVRSGPVRGPTSPAGQGTGPGGGSPPAPEGRGASSPTATDPIR